jgi:hypothetical protein
MARTRLGSGIARDLKTCRAGCGTSFMRKKTLRRCVKLRRLKGIERASDTKPRLRASQFRHTLDEQGENANAHMRLNAMRKPVKHGRHFDLRALQRPKAALNDQEGLYSRWRHPPDRSYRHWFSAPISHHSAALRG